MAALARSNNRPTESGPEDSSGEIDPTMDRWPVRSAVHARPVRWTVSAQPIPVPRAPTWLPSPVGERVFPMTRRWRPAHLVAAAAVTLAVLGSLSWLGHGRSARIPAETAVVRVGAGETLWDVAQRVAPESDPSLVVERIRQLNRIDGSAVQPGQQLRVPDGR